MVYLKGYAIILTTMTFEVSSFIQQIPNELLEVVINIDNLKIQSDVSRDEIDDYLDDLSGKRNSNKEKKILFAQLAEAEADNDVDLQASIMQQLLEIADIKVSQYN